MHIGYAADGFPIHGPFIDDGGTVRRVASGYSLKTGDRVSQSGEGAFPGESYDGTFRDDYEFTGTGDLDECNGREGVVLIDEQEVSSYAYYLTYTYPYIPRCFKATPDPSFAAGPGGGGMGPPPGGGMGPPPG